ncbi:hypothetical protein [Tessaracoccus caeni]|uniref:hypothetical protein n=1 Tax=Tessaracoccus caeni TaxID=3031239 RepID=UPI0023DC6904|nr:hypothetical protein [Tessaracoccus caeni]MDF1487833.1 hypothetical protein [Tessaracoccus caeni]
MSAEVVEGPWYPDRRALVAAVLAGPVSDDLWCYFTLWQLAEEAVDNREATVDELDRRLAAALETPTLWGALAASRAEAVAELPTAADARAAAARLLPEASPDVALQLVMAGLVASDDPALGDLMGHTAAAASRAMASAWAGSSGFFCTAADLVSGTLWLAASGKLDDQFVTDLAVEEARLWREAEKGQEPDQLAWLLLL